jgi:hypothetical protein
LGSSGRTPSGAGQPTAFRQGSGGEDGESETFEEYMMKAKVTDRMAGGDGGGEGGDSLPGEPWPGPQDPPSPDGGPKVCG